MLSNAFTPNRLIDGVVAIIGYDEYYEMF